MKLKLPNWYGFNHEAVAAEFKGDLTFVNEFCVKGEYSPVAVYHAANPDRTKGHKDYMLLQQQGDGGLVRGMTSEEIEKFRFQEGIHCLHCDQVIYSVMCHDMCGCGCKQKTKRVFIDGGRNYIKVSRGEKSLFEMVKIDLLKSRILREGKDVTDEEKPRSNRVARRR
jgi:hypothetical protein